MLKSLAWTVGILLAILFLAPVLLVGGKYAWFWALEEVGVLTPHIQQKKTAFLEEIRRLQLQVEELSKKVRVPAPVAAPQRQQAAAPVAPAPQVQQAAVQPAVPATAPAVQPAAASTATSPRHLGFLQNWRKRLEEAGCTATGAGPNGRLRWNCPCHDANGLPIPCADSPTAPPPLPSSPPK